MISQRTFIKYTGRTVLAGIGFISGMRLCGAAAQAANGAAITKETNCPVCGDKNVTEPFVKIRQKHGIPALAGLLLTSKGIIAMGAVGVRKAGTDVAVTMDDLWHMGSETKAMTSGLIARLVERKKLSWDNTVAELFPALANGFLPEHKQTTLRQLLCHRAGLPANLTWRKFSQQGTLRAQRLNVVREAFSSAALQPPGSKFLYSNLGYVIAGTAAEVAMGKPWEELIQEEVFQPLKMTHAGFGGSGTLGKIDQPWGHLKDAKPVRGNGPEMDNPAVIGPAGRVHCTIQDWSRFVGDLLRGIQGHPGILKPASYQTIITPPPDATYAMGWGVASRPWGGGRVLTHTGCNTMNYANVWVAPERDFAVLVCANQGDDIAFKATDEAVGVLIKLAPKRS
jgi:CubicO group peptidase (beta-lactamase class C family)